jgi:DNA-binding transcriptional regulator LsrR (DeoR family)
METNESIIKRIHSLYWDKQYSMAMVAERLGISIQSTILVREK